MCGGGSASTDWHLWRRPPLVAGVWWAHTLDWHLWLSLTYSLVCGWGRITLDWHLWALPLLVPPSSCVVVSAIHLNWLYVSLSSPPVVWCGASHTLDWLYVLSLSLSTCSWVWWQRIHLIGSMTLSSSPPVAGVWWEAYTWLASMISLLSTCSWCVVSASNWIGHLMTSPLHLELVLVGRNTLDWQLWTSSSSPPIDGVWWAHYHLNWLYVSLSSPPVAGVWWAHTLDWLYDSLSSPPVAGVVGAHTLDWLLCTLSPLHL